MNKVVTLNEGWLLKAIDKHGPLTEQEVRDLSTSPKGTWREIHRMPMQVQDVLLAADEIPTPWLAGRNEESLWVAKNDWIYRVGFHLQDEAERCQLRFHGLDTLVDVYLNGALIGSHANQYLPLYIDIAGLEEENTLLLHFRSVYHFMDKVAIPSELEGRVSPQEMLRKMSNEFGDYLGPKPHFTRVGVYAAVEVVTLTGPSIEIHRVGSSLTEDLTSGRVDVHSEGTGCPDPDTCIEVDLYDPHGRHRKSARSFLDAVDNGWEVDLYITIDNPELWWPRGYGDPALYTVETRIVQDGVVLERLVKDVGFRRITWHQPLHFLVNGHPVHLRGAAMGPLDLVSLCWNSNRMRILLDWAENSYMNTLRYWAQLGPMDDEFYRECDRRGFLVWQDFQTNGQLPDTPEYMDVFRKEAEAMVNRLRHHPSILLWCGGNENLMWHLRRFDQNPYTSDTADTGPYAGWKILTDVFPNVCRRLDPDRYYLIDTPHFGRFPNDPAEGSTHGYSHVWWVPGRSLPNFTAEDTRMGPYELKSLKRFMKEEDIWPTGYTDHRPYGRSYPYPDTWLPHTSNESWRKVGEVERFYDAHDTESLIYRICEANAKYYGELIDRCRRGRYEWEPKGLRRNGGYLYWRFNDAWPMHSYAKIDYFLEPTRTYYAVRRSYVPVRVSIDAADDIHIWVTNDTRRDIQGTLIIELFDFAANRRARRTERFVDVRSGESSHVATLDEFGMFRRELIVVARLMDNAGQPLDRDLKLLENERSLLFPESVLTLEQRGDSIIVASDTFARCVQLTGDAAGDAFGWMFEDNYFDLLPGDRKHVRIMGQHRKGAISARAFYSPNVTTLAYELV